MFAKSLIIFCQMHCCLCRLDKNVHRMAINHGILDIMLDKDDGQQLQTGKTMIDVGLLTRT